MPAQVHVIATTLQLFAGPVAALTARYAHQVCAPSQHTHPLSARSLCCSAHAALEPPWTLSQRGSCGIPPPAAPPRAPAHSLSTRTAALALATREHAWCCPPRVPRVPAGSAWLASREVPSSTSRPFSGHGMARRRSHLRSRVGTCKPEGVACVPNHQRRCRAHWRTSGASFDSEREPATTNELRPTLAARRAGAHGLSCGWPCQARAALTGCLAARGKRSEGCLGCRSGGASSVTICRTPIPHHAMRAHTPC